MTLTVIRAPEWVHIRALKVLNQYHNRAKHPVRMVSTGFLSLKVNPRWRLLSKDHGKNWQLMSHERYNGKKDRK